LDTDQDFFVGLDNGTAHRPSPTDRCIWLIFRIKSIPMRKHQGRNQLLPVVFKKSELTTQIAAFFFAKAEEYDR
jgi:hypothetical protein